MTRTTVIIDTEQYAGNFEREMTHFITGQMGECEVGYRGFDSIEDGPVFERVGVLQVDYESEGCHRPTKIWETPGWFNDSLGGHWKDTPENEVPALEAYRAKVAEYHAKGQGAHMTGETLNKWPCYNSVAIFFDGEINDDDMAMIHHRAKMFAEGYRDILGKPKEITITGIRQEPFDAPSVSYY